MRRVQLCEHVLCKAWQDADLRGGIRLQPLCVCAHRVCLARARLAIRQDRAIEAIQEVREQRLCDAIVDVLLLRVRAKDKVEKVLAAICHLYCALVLCSSHARCAGLHLASSG